MARILLACALSLLFASLSSGQVLRSCGLKAAYTSADQKDEGTLSLETKSRPGINVGVFAEWLDVPWFSIVTQIEYAQRGTGVEFTVTSPSGPEPIGTMVQYGRLDYLSIPLMAKFIVPLGSVSPFVLAGPRFDYLAGYKSDNGLFDPLYAQFKKTMFGASVGAGAEIRDVLAQTILVEVRFNLDFGDSYTSPLLKVKNTAIDVWAGIAF